MATSDDGCELVAVPRLSVKFTFSVDDSAQQVHTEQLAQLRADVQFERVAIIRREIGVERHQPTDLRTTRLVLGHWHEEVGLVEAWWFVVDVDNSDVQHRRRR